MNGWVRFFVWIKFPLETRDVCVCHVLFLFYALYRSKATRKVQPSRTPIEFSPRDAAYCAATKAAPAKMKWLAVSSPSFRVRRHKIKQVTFVARGWDGGRGSDGPALRRDGLVLRLEASSPASSLYILPRRSTYRRRGDWESLGKQAGTRESLYRAHGEKRFTKNDHQGSLNRPSLCGEFTSVKPCHVNIWQPL